MSMGMGFDVDGDGSKDVFLFGPARRASPQLGCFVVVILLVFGGAIFVVNIIQSIETSKQMRKDRNSAIAQRYGVWFELGLYRECSADGVVTDEVVVKALADERCLQIQENGQVLVGNKLFGAMIGPTTIETVDKQEVGTIVDADTGMLTVLFPNRRPNPNYTKVRQVAASGGLPEGIGEGGEAKQDLSGSEEERRARLNGVWQPYAWEIGGQYHVVTAEEVREAESKDGFLRINENGRYSMGAELRGKVVNSGTVVMDGTDAKATIRYDGTTLCLDPQDGNKFFFKKVE